ncbi:sensor domain-containing diguanylate cyclase [Sporosarcina trichiuri]|uniref:sensor domain-containing diguanylate cyclase n=1 Tax=Sporosarcina trichiuri TaxID=3056445 RepID=UPI0025B44FB8|nr:sensor domain-containing diguanylate cyclase [Sporosarcina sp. 0.2-SM1T-5]WJY28164.1 sensor domain-containing diguanylate cyclase [Sporosarcina sp. 0.2-SM1T-5]
MKLTGRPFLILLLLWTLIVPAGTVYLLTAHPLPDVNWLWLGLSAIFGFFSIYFPIIYNGKSIVLFVWFTLPVFLLYGLTAEVLVTQLIVITAVLSKAHTGDVLYRLLYNSLAYFLLSFLSAAAFALAGAEVGSLAFGSLVTGVIAYQVVYSVLYDAIFKLYGTLTRRMRRNTMRETLFHYFRLLLVVPLAVSLYYMLVFYGAIGYVLIGIPFFLMTYLLRVNGQREDLTGFIQAAGKIGQQLAAMTRGNEINEEYLTKASSLFSADYIYLYDAYEGWLEPRYFYADGKKQTPPTVRLAAGQGIAGRLLSGETSELFTRREQWIRQTVTVVPENLESLMCIPLIRHQKVVGGVVLGSSKRNSFKEFHLNVLDLLSSYFVVAAEKAKYIEEAEQESDMCALTGLYNYRYLERQLESEIAALKRGSIDQVALVMLDIDHFKAVNDTYGHENGNRVLQQLSRLLKEQCPSGGTAARYGGEEFVYILPGYSKEKAAAFAEMLRQLIEKTQMTIQSHLDKGLLEETITLTSSLGVAASPEDTDEAMVLLRNADRALYIGAKQSGRNRVGVYVK